MNDREHAPSDLLIQFEEVSSNAVDFLHELNDPNLLRNREIPAAAKTELRRHQVARLRSTISILEAKRDEFNRRMSEYLTNLGQLIDKLGGGDAEDAGSNHDADRSTQVRCLHCESERDFNHLNVIFARESEESLQSPTELYVLDRGELKKGHFRCTNCGTEGLVIRAS